MMTTLTVFAAKRIITMDDSLPEATAVAVRDGLIVEVGSLETMKPWLDAHEHVFDETFADKVLMPGFIDPHLHPTMAALLLQMRFVSGVEWRLPWEHVLPTVGKQAYLDRIREIEQSMEDPEEPLFIWGYHFAWHGRIRKADLDDISTTRPIIMWFRSFHELVLSCAALDWVGLTREKVGNSPQVDFENGHFYENGLRLALNAGIISYLLAPERYQFGMERFRQVTHFGGHTTIGDLCAGMFDLEMEWQMSLKILDPDEAPFRTQFVPAPLGLVNDARSKADVFELIKTLPDRNTDKLQFRDHVKLFTDGAMFSQLMMMQEPGYIDGHEGEWLMPPEIFEEAARQYWNAGYKIHVHCTGNLGLELALDTLEKLQGERPRFNHRYTIEHFGISTTEQVRRIKDLGAIVSANVYYMYELSGKYTREGLGYERASQMVRLGECRRQGVAVTIHSDYTMAPALPLNSAWVAVNRVNEEGDRMAPNERLSLHDALRAITVEAAYVLGMENEIGSIRSGKKADFTVLEKDPYTEPVEHLKDIPIWGTVFEGVAHPIER